MTWAWVYLAVSLVGAVLVANAFRPARHQLLLVPSFFAGWYTAEMPVWHIAWQVAATVAFGVEGALGSWPGWVALGVNAASWTGLVVHARISAGARGVFDRAEEEMPLPASDVDGLPVHGGDTMWRFPRLLYPLPRPARSVRAVRNVDYAGDGIRAHRLDIIRRRGDPPEGAPVLVYIHGGAWVIGDKREQGLPLLYELARRGWVTVTINYRLSPKATWPDHIVDCKRAVAWVRDHIAEYGGDPGFIAVSGGSAGGHLCAPVGAHPGRPRLSSRASRTPTPRWTSCVPFYGVYDMTAGRGTSGYDEGLLHAARTPGVQAPPRRRPRRLRGRLPTAPGERRCAAVLRGPRHQRHVGPGGRGPRLRERAAGGVQVRRAVRRAPVHPARLRRAPVGPQRPRRGRRRPVPRRGAVPPFPRATGTGRRDPLGLRDRGR